ncbi:hypothetical protein M3Y96_00571800 [Aphelenchoides besseyi]|nr:hypothetical protein M3Y96_00571800 [Aphelenchoides besseyi]
MFSTNYEVLLFFLTVLTIILQIYVLFLTRYKLPKSMEHYRFFLYVFTLWDLVFTMSFGFVVAPYPLTPIFACDLRGIGGMFSYEIAQIALSLTFSFGANVIYSQFWCLCYRFVAVLPNKSYQQAFCNVKWKMIFFLCGQCLTILLGVGFFNTLTDEKVRCFVDTIKPQVYFKSTYLVLSAHEMKREDKRFEIHARAVLIELAYPWTLQFLLYVFILFVAFEVVCAILVVVTLRTLNKTSASYSARTLKLQRQLLRVLVIQLACPIIFIFLPVIAPILATFLAIPVLSDLTVEIGLFMLALVGFINSLICLIFVGPYAQHTYLTFIKPLFSFTRGLQFVSKVCPTIQQQQSTEPATPTAVKNAIASNEKTLSQRII